MTALTSAAAVKEALAELADPGKAKSSSWFFKTGRGQYGEGDKFVGVSVPEQRRVAKHAAHLKTRELQILFDSPVHEHRLTAAFILVNQYSDAALAGKEKLYKFYRKQLVGGRINNWDIVDSSAHQIMGQYLKNKSRQILYDDAASDSLWRQRAAMIATYAFIKDEEYTDTLLLAEQLLTHQHDLIQKAVGWMLREVANRDQAVAESFLQRHYTYMPRTMLRYAIEKFREPLRRAYLEGSV